MIDARLFAPELVNALEDAELAIRELLPVSPRRAARHRAARLTDRELTAALDELRAQANSAMTAP